MKVEAAGGSSDSKNMVFPWFQQKALTFQRLLLVLSFQMKIIISRHHFCQNCFLCVFLSNIYIQYVYVPNCPSDGLKMPITRLYMQLCWNNWLFGKKVKKRSLTINSCISECPFCKNPKIISFYTHLRLHLNYVR